MTTDIGIEVSSRKAAADELSKILADEFVLYTKTRNAHWNVEGIDFYDKHKFLNRNLNNWMLLLTILQSVFVYWDIMPGNFKFIFKFNKFIGNDSLYKRKQPFYTGTLIRP